MPGSCQAEGCDCERFIASWSPTVCALCRHPHQITSNAQPQNNLRRGPPRQQQHSQGFNGGRAMSASSAGNPSRTSNQQPLSIRRVPSLSQSTQGPGIMRTQPPPRPAVAAPSTAPRFTPNIQEPNRNPPITSPRQAISSTPQQRTQEATLSMRNPQVVKFFQTLDQALKKTRKRGLTKREAEKLLNSGLLTIANGQLKVNANALAAATGQTTSQRESIENPPIQPLKVAPRSTTAPTAARRPSPSVNVKIHETEIRQLRAALEREREARKAAEFRNQSQKGLFTSDKRNEALQQRISELESRIRDRDGYVAQLQKRCQESEDKLHDLEARDIVINEFTKKFQEKMKLREVELMHLKEELTNERSSKILFQQKSEDLSRQVTEVQQELQRNEREKTILQETSRAATQKFQQQLEQLQSFSEKQIQQLTKRLEAEELERIALQTRKGTNDDSKRSKLLNQIEDLTTERNSFDERSRSSVQQLETLRAQFQESEDARKEIATRILQLQLQYADTLEQYERRFGLQRRQSSEAAGSAHQLSEQLQQLQKIINILDTRTTNLDRNKDKKLIAELGEFSQNLHAASQSLERTISGQQKAYSDYEKNSDDFLRAIAEVRREIHAATEICNQEAARILQEELNKLQFAYDTDINQLRRQLQSESHKRQQLEEQLEPVNNSTASPVDINVISDLQSHLEDEVKARQRIEEENQQLLMRVNTLQVVGTDVGSLQSQFDMERSKMKEEIDITRFQYHQALQDLQEKLEEAEQHRANLENTKNALESTVDLLTMQNESVVQNTIDASSVEQAVKEERKREREKTKILEKRVEELQQQLSDAETRAISAATGSDWDNEMEQVRKAMEAALADSHRENALLSSQLESARAQLQGFEYDEYELPIPPSAPPPPPPSGETNEGNFVPLPPPPPPPAMPKATNKQSSRANLFADIQSASKTSLKPLAEVPEKVVAPDRLDLMAEIRGGASLLKPASERKESSNAPKFEDPQNMLQVLARVLLTRREGIEDDREEDGEDESWDA